MHASTLLEKEQYSCYTENKEIKIKTQSELLELFNKLDLRDSIRKEIDNLGDVMNKMPALAYLETHRFADGIYARECFIPAGSFIIGKIHTTEHICILSQGKTLVSNSDYSDFDLYEAPYTFISQPGTKRILLVLEDITITTIHNSHKLGLDGKELDPIIVENTIAVNSWEDIDAWNEKHKNRKSSVIEYKRFRTLRNEKEKYQLLDMNGKEL